MTTSKTPLRVLILEDSRDDADLLLRHLRKAGYVLDWKRAETPETLRAALSGAEWDVVLADYSMPAFLAPDALAIIKEAQLDVPFIIVSGSIGEAAAVEAMKAGAHDFFLKDNLARLVSAIERERGEARVRQERRQALQELRESQDRLREAVRARDEFLSIASHELKTPLSSLTLQVERARELLGNREASSVARAETKLEGVSRQVARLTTLINNLLDVTRINSGRMVLSPETFDLREALDAVLVGKRVLLARSGSILNLRADLAQRPDRRDDGDGRDVIARTEHQDAAGGDPGASPSEERIGRERHGEDIVPEAPAVGRQPGSDREHEDSSSGRLIEESPRCVPRRTSPPRPPRPFGSRGASVRRPRLGQCTV